MIVRVCALLTGILAGAAACRNSTDFSIPGAPTSDITRNATISGRIVAYGSGQPVAGATVILAGRAAVSDSTGGYTLTGVPGSGVGAVTVSGPNLLFRTMMFQLAPSRTDVGLDVLLDTAPFSIQFYRYFVRNGYDQSGLVSTNPWTINPSFYVKTIVEGTEIRVDPEVIARIEANFRRSVPELSGGRFQVAAFESGEAERPAREGWVNVDFVPSLGGAFGRASVGGNQGIMELRWFGPPGISSNELHCFSNELFTADHEITHTMGFWHTPNPIEDSFSGEGCAGAPRADHVRYHAGVMYSRPRGNRDPDIDPSDIVHAQAPGAGGRALVACRWDH